MVSKGVEHHRKRENMAPHHQGKEEELSRPKALPTQSSEENITRIGHIVYMRVAQLELPDHVAGIGGQEPEANN